MTAAGQSALNVRGLDTVVIYDARYGNVVERGPERAAPALPRRQRDPADGGPGARPGAERRSRHPERPRPRLRAAPAHAARVPARRRRRAGGDHLRRARRGRARPRPARCRSTGPPTGARWSCSPSAAWWRTAGSRRTAARSRRMPVERALGRAAGARRRGADADGGRVRQHRLAAPDDARGARPARRGRERQRPPHRLQPLRRGGQPARLPGRGVRAAAAPVRGRPRGVGRAARRAASRRSKTRRSALASVYRSLELPLPEAAALRRRRTSGRQWADLLARFMPFDLVIDEHTADGQEARVSKTSVAGSWGAVAGTLRFFADRFGVPRAAIEGTTLSYDLVREHAALGPPRGGHQRAAQAPGPRGRAAALLLRLRSRHRGRADPRRRSPSRSARAARDVLADALLAGETGAPRPGPAQARARGARRAVAAVRAARSPAVSPGGGARA